jgi:type IV secretory pathway VirB9-like protein
MRKPFHALIIAIAMLACSAAPGRAQDVDGVREVTMTDRHVVSLMTRQRFFTDVFFPEEDLIKDAACGDPAFWVVEWSDNVLRVKPAKKGATTNLGVRMASGRSYTFKLIEGQGNPDYKVFVVNDPSTRPATPRFVPVADVEALQAELGEVRASLERERQAAHAAVAALREQYPSTLRFDYRQAKYEAPFWVSAIWHDGRFTYIRSEAPELPALYEIVDGRPALVNFDVKDGHTYIVPKVLDRAYLARGKKRWTFERR